MITVQTEVSVHVPGSKSWFTESEKGKMKPNKTQSPIRKEAQSVLPTNVYPYTYYLEQDPGVT